MSRIDQTSGTTAGAVGVCVAVMPQTVKTPAGNAYGRVTPELAYSLRFMASLGTYCDTPTEQPVAPMGYRLNQL